MLYLPKEDKLDAELEEVGRRQYKMYEKMKSQKETLEHWKKTEIRNAKKTIQTMRKT